MKRLNTWTRSERPRLFASLLGFAAVQALSVAAVLAMADPSGEVALAAIVPSALPQPRGFVPEPPVTRSDAAIGDSEAGRLLATRLADPCDRCGDRE